MYTPSGLSRVALSGPWQVKHLSERIGRMSRLKAEDQEHQAHNDGPVEIRHGSLVEQENAANRLATGATRASLRPACSAANS